MTAEQKENPVQGLVFDFKNITTASHLSVKDAESTNILRVIKSGYTGQVLIVIESGDTDTVFTKRMSVEAAEAEFGIEIII